MKENIIKDKSYAFALKMVDLCRILCADQKEYVLSKQLLRSGTAIGALVREGEHAQSKADFISKMSIALKEANETDYWLALMKDSDYISINQYKPLEEDVKELIKLLVSIVKTARNTK